MIDLSICIYSVTSSLSSSVNYYQYPHSPDKINYSNRVIKCPKNFTIRSTTTTVLLYLNIIWQINFFEYFFVTVLTTTHYYSIINACSSSRQRIASSFFVEVTSLLKSGSTWVHWGVASCLKFLLKKSIAGADQIITQRTFK